MSWFHRFQCVVFLAATLASEMRLPWNGSIGGNLFAVIEERIWFFYGADFDEGEIFEAFGVPMGGGFSGGSSGGGGATSSW